jgi:UDP-N-acetylmuramoyl-tripeptide--D-alanyl-D-alanine ligase
MMRALQGREIREATRGRWLSRSEPLPVRGVSIDSRTAGRDDLFIAIEGENFDGHDYLPQAADAGCIAAVVRLDKAPPAELAERFPVGVIGVENTRAALLDLAGYYRKVLAGTVIGITGSNGKTTVKRMIEHILAKRLEGSASPKSFNNDIGVPLTLLTASAGSDYVLCEVGSSTPGEIMNLARAVRPDIAVITSIGPAHLDKLGSIERIAAEKAALLSWLGERDIAVATADSPELNHSLRSYEKRTIRFGESDEAQLRLTAYEPTETGQRFQINGRDWVSLAVPGKHNALNALASMAVAARFGFSQEDAAAALADFAGVEMRLQRIETGSLTIINDSYNANPASMVAAAAVLSETPGSRRVFIAGDMGELGETSEQLHRQAGRDIAARRIDLVVGIGAQGKLIAEGAAEVHKTTAALADLDAARRELGELIQPGDVVLLKASRAVGLESLLPVLQGVGQ